MTTNPYLGKYSKLTNSELINIIRNTDKFEFTAIEAAEEELRNRQLSEKEIQETKAYLETIRQDESNQQQKMQYMRGRASSYVSMFSPISLKKITPEKFIIIISVFFGGIFLYQVFTSFSMIVFMFNDIDHWDKSVVYYLLPFITLPIATILFGLKKKLGWTLLASYLTYMVFTVLYSYIIQIATRPSGLTILFPGSAITIAQIVISIGFLFSVCLSAVRGIYMVDKFHMFLIIGIIGLLTTVQWWGLLATVFSN